MENVSMYESYTYIKMWAENLLQQVLLELSEEEVDVVDGVELCDEGLDVLQENLQEEMTNQAKVKVRDGNMLINCLQ